MAFRRWLKAAAPDVLLTEHDEFARELQGMRGLTGTLPLVSCSARPDKRGGFPFPGNYDKPREIGAEAVEKLARKIALGQRGVPENPRTTLVRGAWVGVLPPPRKG